MSVRPGAEPYAHDGDDIGVLLCHGFTGNPSSLRPWAESIAAAAVSKLTASGILTSILAGTAAYSAYDPRTIA